MAPERVCHALLPFLSIALGVLLPTALAAYCWRAPAARAEVQAGSGADALGSGSGSTGSGGGGAAGAPLPLGQAAGAAHRAGCSLRGAAAAAVAATNRMLHTLFCKAPGLESRALVCWLLVALSWWLSSRLDGRIQ